MINPVELGLHSKGIYEKSSNEIEYRCCARSAYYSIFHYFKTIADSLPGGYDISLGSHERVIRKLMDSTDSSYKKYGVVLSNYRKVRVKADYKIDASFSK
ncbi:hypothetical protein [Pectobacterium polaris]|uniref:Uncharacterized protein n=1 Tax=Pectobacterium polaris TaxID=2042057 RepID=A0AAW4NZY4_9GAMM|nr:hypothetical protein [Pectobacterium polaris]ASY82364.1 hypothetical protein BJK05_21235 [Pectobacterium polaris]MBW5892579.1 hypothetical protein [Pectobacterium polaris]MCA6943434.1 hypothetical protein [Pectobacterium polaris]MCA6958811.1 hypothetical protein [Pectobacterium polaris]MCL6360544.1 hypothetical protein [Pectobacterium polaris]